MAIDSQIPNLFLCLSDEVAEGQYREFRVKPSSTSTSDGPVDLIVTRHQGLPRAWFNVCPHQGRSLNISPDRFLTDEHNQLVCCVHGAVFEPDQGRCVSGPCLNAHLKAVAITEMDGKIELKEGAFD